MPVTPLTSESEVRKQIAHMQREYYLTLQKLNMERELFKTIVVAPVVDDGTKM